MNVTIIVRIFWVREMEWMCAQTRPWFILSSERVLGEWSQNPCQLQGKNPLNQKKISPEEDGTLDAASSMTAIPIHYQRTILAPCAVSDSEWQDYQRLTLIIIIAFKGAIRDSLQSPHSTANCLQHVRPSGPSVQITCNTSRAHHVQVSCYVPLGTKGQLSY